MVPSGASIPLSGENGSESPSVAESPSGFVVVWNDTGGQSRIRARRLDATGSPSAPAVAVDAGALAHNTLADVTRAGDGFIVVWRQDLEGDDEASRVTGRFLDAAGNPVGGEFRIDEPHAAPAGHFYAGAPAVAADANGFVVAWAQGTTQTIGNVTYYDSTIYGRHFSLDGVPTTGELLLAGGGPAPAIDADIDRTAAGFVLSWVRAISDHFGSVYVRALTSAGQLADNSEVLAYDGGAVDAELAAGGQAVHVLWTSEYYTDVYTSEVRARKIDETSTRSFLVSASAPKNEGLAAGANGLAAVTIGGDRLAAAWTTALGDTPAEIVVREFSGDGDALGPVVQLSHDGPVRHPAIAAIDPRRVLVVWQTGAGAIASRLLRIRAPECGDADENGVTTTNDALAALRASVQLQPCAPCVCDADGSGAHTAHDALVVLQSALDLPVTLHCPICSEGPGDPLRLVASPTCAATHVRVPRSSLPGDLSLLSCSLDGAVTDSGCNATLQIDEAGMVVDVRATESGAYGCNLDAPLLRCHARPADLDAIANTAVVGCGCSCAEQCDTHPKLCAGQSADPSCSSAPARPVPPSGSATAQRTVTTTAARRAVAFTSTTQFVSTSSVTSFCGTCCNLDELGSVEIAEASPVPVTEMILRVEGDAGASECSECYAASTNARGIFLGSDGDSHSKICVIDYTGIDVGKLGTCEGYGSLAPGPAQVLRASGLNFEPLDEFPTVNVTVPASNGN